MHNSLVSIAGTLWPQRHREPNHGGAAIAALLPYTNPRTFRARNVIFSWEGAFLKPFSPQLLSHPGQAPREGSGTNPLAFALGVPRDGDAGRGRFFFRALLFQGRFPSRHGSGNPKRRGSPGGAPGGSGRKAAAGCGSGSSPPEPRRCREGGAAGRAPPYSRGVGGAWGGGRCPAPFPSPPLPPRRCRSLIAAAGGRRKKKNRKKRKRKARFSSAFRFSPLVGGLAAPGGAPGEPSEASPCP